MSEKRYAEDSTRGDSVLNPKNYKGDIMAQVWLDSRVLATLSEWVDEERWEKSKFLSEVIREGLDALVEHLVSRGEVKMVDDTNVALAVLYGKYRTKPRKDKGGKNLLHNKILSERRVRLKGEIGLKSRITNDVDKEMTNESRIDKLVEIYNKIEAAEREESRKESLRRIEEGINSGTIPVVRDSVSIPERDKEIIARENAPIDMDFLRSKMVKE